MITWVGSFLGGLTYSFRHNSLLSPSTSDKPDVRGLMMIKLLIMIMMKLIKLRWLVIIRLVKI